MMGMCTKDEANNGKINFAQIVYEKEKCEKIILDGKIKESSERCKELFSKIPILWHDIPVFFSGFELGGKVFFITVCRNARFFSEALLRKSRLLSYNISPHVCAAISRCGEEVYIRVLNFTKMPECHDGDLLSSAAIAAIKYSDF